MTSFYDRYLVVCTTAAVTKIRRLKDVLKMSSSPTRKLTPHTCPPKKKNNKNKNPKKHDVFKTSFYGRVVLQRSRDQKNVF